MTNTALRNSMSLEPETPYFRAVPPRYQKNSTATSSLFYCDIQGEIILFPSRDERSTGPKRKSKKIKEFPYFHLTSFLIPRITVQNVSQKAKDMAQRNRGMANYT